MIFVLENNLPRMKYQHFDNLKSKYLSTSVMLVDVPEYIFISLGPMYAITAFPLRPNPGPPTKSPKTQYHHSLPLGLLELGSRVLQIGINHDS